MPDHEESQVRSLGEDELRETVLVPLLKNMGLKDVVLYHGGSAEKGKDIFGYYEGPLGDLVYYFLDGCRRGVS